MADGAQAKAGRKYDWVSFWMLLVVMLSLTAVFLVGLAVLAIWADDGPQTRFDATAIVAVLSPALTAVGAVAAGVFGYTLGSRGAAEAHEVAVTASRKETAVLQDAETRARGIERIAGRSRVGGTGDSGKHELSSDDIDTILAAASPMAAGLGLGTQPEE